MPNIGTLPRSSARRRDPVRGGGRVARAVGQEDAVEPALRRPWPAGVCAGNTVVSIPRPRAAAGCSASSRSRRRPRGRRCPGPSPARRPTSDAASYGSGDVTVRARSAPAMPGVVGTRATSDSASRSTVEIAARIDPRSRSRRVRRRVSMPSMPATPDAASDLLQRGLARARRTHGATLPAPRSPATWIRARLRVERVHAVVALVRVGHRHDLAGVRGVGQDLLVARHPGVEDRLAEGLALRPERRCRGTRCRPPARAAPRVPSPGGLPVGHRETAAQHREPDPAPSASWPRNAALRRLRGERRLDGPPLLRIEHHEVRRAARPRRGPPWPVAPRIARRGADRASMARGRVRRPGLDQVREHRRQRRLQPDRARAEPGRTPPPSPRPRAAHGRWRSRRSSRRRAPARRASRSSAVRSGGFTFRFVS